MKPDVSIPHPEDHRLQLGYTPVLSEDEQTPFLGIVPGFAHSLEHFQKLSQELAARKISTALLDFRVNGNVVSRNAVGLDTYRSGISTLISLIEEDTHRKISGLIGHSQGGLLVQEWVQETRQLHDAFDSILLAPIPFGGAKDAALKLARHHFPIFAKIVGSFVRKNGMKGLSDSDIQKLFFEPMTPEEIVSEAKSGFVHVPLRVFVEDIIRPWARPKIHPTDRPTLLIRSDTDGLFPPEQYDDFGEMYSDLQTIDIGGGGHDFFIQHADEVAAHIAKYLAERGQLRTGK